MSGKPVVVWFRQDLRVGDHPALSAAVASGAPVLPVYVLDDTAPGAWRLGGASRWWLAQSLRRLQATLGQLGSRLIVRSGPAGTVIPDLAREVGAGAVHVSRMIEPWAQSLDGDVRAACETAGIAFRRYGGSLLFEPEAVRNQAGEAYRVYSAFARAALANEPPRYPLAAPGRLVAPSVWPDGLGVADLRLEPTRPDWASGLRETWQPGEASARKRLSTFLDGAIARYHLDRDRPDLAGTSRLGAHLHFGEISPNQCWHGSLLRDAVGETHAAGAKKFRAELLWREFSAHLLQHHPDLPSEPLRREFKAFPWREDRQLLRAWQRGRTGYPIVDAGMRELWLTGTMHNRVRMIAASFLIKHLLIPWQRGEAWFWDTLVDADLANNAASWQWVAGSGADAAPYFRIFNPVRQSQTFDPEGRYVHAFVPELRGLPPPHVHAPWMAPVGILSGAGVVLGETYPHPVIDHRLARERALAAFASLKAV